MNSVIRLKNVTRRFGKKTALNNVTLDVPSGCVFALLGENGAGKTTAIKNILGLDKPSQGTIEVVGLNPSRSGVEIRRKVGYVADSPSLYDWMTVAETGWFASGFYPEGFVDRFSFLCQQFELETNQKVKALSKGGKAKVALALSMAHDPDLLIMDEPTSGLDTMVRRKFLESMVDVAAEGRTVLLSSHLIPEVERVADHVAIIHQGVVLISDRLENLKQTFERWVLSFHSDDLSIPEFEGQIISHEGQVRRRQQMMIRNPGPEALWKLRDCPAISDVEVHTPSLEEIFVSLIKHGAPVTDRGFENQQSNPTIDQKAGGKPQ